MSHTLNSTSDRGDSGRAYLDLSRMMREGRSWSGGERNCAFLNMGDMRFAGISSLSGLDFPDDGRALAVSDWDHDGDLDLWISNRNAPRLRFLRNDSTGSRSLSLLLEGDGRSVNRDAIGVSVELLSSDGRRSRKTVRAGDGFLTQSSRWLHFGMGEARGIDEIVVHWTADVSVRIVGLEIGKRYRIMQGVDGSVEWSRPGKVTAIQPAKQVALPVNRGGRIPLVTLLRLPTSIRRAIKVAGLPENRREGRSVLLTLWASWCRPCLVELGEFKQREREIRAAGIDIVAFSVDGLDPKLAAETPGTTSSPDQIMRDLEFPFRSAKASEELVEQLQYLHNALLPMYRSLPVPSSFLIDPQGRLSVIYKGKLSVDDLIRDVDHSSRSLLERRLAASPRPGSLLETREAREALEVTEAQVRFQFADNLISVGQFEDAGEQLDDLLVLRPDFAQARVNAGFVHERAQHKEAARREYHLAIKQQPDLAQAHFNLAALSDREGDYRQALIHYSDAMRHDPSLPKVQSSIGMLYAKRGDLASAARYFQKEIENHPDDADAHNHLGLVQLQKGKNALAEPMFRRAIELRPRHADAHNNLGIALRRRGDFAAAATEFQRAIDAHPGFVEAHSNLGGALIRLGRQAEARRSLERALEIRPNFGPARNQLVRMK